MNSLKLKLPGKRRRTSCLGLMLDGSRLDGVVVRRTNGVLQIQQSLSVTLSLDPLTAEPELVGREIRNHLDAAGVRERDCVFGLPLKWVLTAHVELPELPEEDITSFLQIEAERGFHADVSTLHMAAARSQTAPGKQQALLAGVPKSQLSAIFEVLRAAKLRPISFGLGIAALQPPRADASEGTLALAIGENQVALEIIGGGGVAAIRTLEAAIENEGGRRILHADLVAREARITLGQLPAFLRDSVRKIRIFGPRDFAQQLADEMELRFESAGMTVEIVARFSADEFGLQLPDDAGVSPALGLAAAYLAGRKPAFELLPPRVTPWKQLVARYSSGKLRTAGAVGAAIAILVVAGFLYQQVQLTALRAQWNGMALKVRDLEGVEQEIRQFRPWYDDSLRGLTILRQLTMAFPEDGVVTAKSVEIRDLNAVTCSGTTRDQQALLKTLDRLRLDKSVADLKVSTIRGSKPPLQFTFDFKWHGGPKGEH